MDASLTSLLAFFLPRRNARRSLALATVTSTAGSTYRKPGARMLIDADGAASGLLSGGCLESDLLEHARAVIETGVARLVEYDLRTSDDVIWGLGLGCEGAMSILLQRLAAQNNYQPFGRMADAHQARASFVFATVVRSTNAIWPVGACVFADTASQDRIGRELKERCRDDRSSPASALIDVHDNGTTVTAFLARVDPPPDILILGAGPDAAPVSRAASALGWAVTVFDHRPAYATPEHFPEAVAVIQGRAEELSARLCLDSFDAAVVMSHHLTADLEYLRQLAPTAISYVGLLGPPDRRRRLAAELGPLTSNLGGRLYGPVGLDIGASTPEAIAIAIVAEIHAVLAGRNGQPYSRPISAGGP